MTEAGLNLIGLVLNVIGGLVIFKWGPPQPSFVEGDPVLYENEELDLKTMALERRYRRMSKLGLVLIIAGFVLQLPAAIRPLTVL